MRLKLKLLSCLLLSALPFASVQAEIHTMIDPSNGRTVYVDSPTGIDGCDAGLLLFETGFVCRSRIPPPPPRPPQPQPVYPPASAVCRGDYPVEFDGVNELRCASGYIRVNHSHQDNAWCEITTEQKALCTPYYPPELPDPGPGHDFGRQFGFMGPDGQLHETKDPNSPPCGGGCVNAGKTDDPSKEPDTSDPNDGPVGNPGGIGGE